VKPVYLDYAATTPMRPEVRAAMAPFLEEVFGNPSSAHRWGRAAAAALAEARAEVAAALGARPSEIYFVRGGTESDNLALLGRCAHIRSRGGTPKLVVSAIEHHAIMDSARHAREAFSADCVVLEVPSDHPLDVEALGDEVDEDTVVSLMWVNNETGIRLPIRRAAEVVREGGGTLHSDAVQAIGKVPVDVSDTPVDLLTVTGHKIYGPKGSGLLFVRTGIDLAPLLHGGGQERALRPGTEDVAGAMGLATAVRLVVAEREEESERLRALRDALEERLRGALDGVRINGLGAPRAPHITSLGIQGVDGQALLTALDLEGVAASGGSACASGSTKGSHVIEALYGEADTRATVRFSLGRGVTPEQIERTAAVTIDVVARMRESGAPS
jgi:cysteine desulfurase